jgi:hypothetical protein
LWQTRIALPANGKSMREALPSMLLAAGPTIGRETQSPVLRDPDEAVKAWVEFGELKVLDDDPAVDPAHSGFPEEKNDTAKETGKN